MLAGRMVQTFEFTEPHLTKRLRFEDGDWDVGQRVDLVTHGGGGLVDIIDLDGKIRRIIHPGNASDHGKNNVTAGIERGLVTDLKQEFRV